MTRLHGKPYASRHGGDAVIAYFGIIDFLQAWTGGKRCAHVIKACCAPPPISTISPGAYAKQFREFFQWKLRGVAHSLPPAYVHVGEGGEVAGARAAKLAEQIEALRGDLRRAETRLALAEARVEELEEERGEPFHDAA
jgi:hypothetical protein